MRLRMHLTLSLSLVLGVGCTRPATQLVVVVESDLPPSQLRCVVVEAGPVVAGAAFEATTERLYFVEDPGLPAVRLPFSFGVAPPGNDARTRVEIRASALSDCTDPSSAAARTVTRTVRTGFLPEQSLVLPVFLGAACLSTTCPEELTCIDGVCGDPDVDPDALRRSRGPGDELSDGGPRRDGGGADAPSSMSPCTITPPQSGCGPTEGCYFPDGVRAPVCLVAGPGSEGSLCSMENDCAASLGCRNDINIDPSVGSECVGVCANDADCASNVCISLGIGFGVCMNVCDPIANTGCGARDCRIAFYTGTSGSRFLTVCSRALGSTAEGAPCSGTSSCAAGLYCDRSVCRQLCDRSTGVGCGGGSSCVAAASSLNAGSTSYGVCMP